MRPAPLPATDANHPAGTVSGWRSAAATAAVGGGLGLASLGALIAPALDITERFEQYAREESRNPADLLDRLGQRFNAANGSGQLWPLSIQRDLDLLRNLVDSNALDREPLSQAVGLLTVAKKACGDGKEQRSAVCNRLDRDELSGEKVTIYGLPVTLERLDYWRQSVDQAGAGPSTTAAWLPAVVAALTTRGIAFAASAPAGVDTGSFIPYDDQGAGPGPLVESQLPAQIHFRIYRDMDQVRAGEIRKALCDRALPGLELDEISNVRTLADQSQARAPLRMRRTTLVYHGDTMLARARQVSAALAEAGVSLPIAPLPSTVAPIESTLELWIGVDDVAVGSPVEPQCDAERLERPL